jgi:DNA-binding MarR family transcriptional regulator
MLDQYIYDQPGHLIRRAHQVAWSVFMDETRAFDMTPVQYSLLVAVGECPAIDATRLSELIDIDRATIGNVVDRLEKRGLLVRSADADDRRAKRISLTRAGRKLIEAVNRIRGKIGERILAPLDAAERATFLKLVSKLVRIDQAKHRASRYKDESGSGRVRLKTKPRTKPTRKSRPEI